MKQSYKKKKDQLIPTATFSVCHAVRQYVRFFLCHQNEALRLHTEPPTESDAVTVEMMNDMTTKADRCDKYKAEWLINLMWV